MKINDQRSEGAHEEMRHKLRPPPKTSETNESNGKKRSGRTWHVYLLSGI